MFELRIYNIEDKKKLMSRGKYTLCLKNHYWHTFHENKLFAYKWNVIVSDSSYKFNTIYNVIIKK